MNPAKLVHRVSARGLSGPVIACLFVSVVAGCSDLGTPFKPTPLSQLSATSLEFGTIAVGQSTTRSVVVSNHGTGKLQVTTSVGCVEYSVESGGGAFALAPGESRTLVVRFTPSGVGSFVCELGLGADTPPVTLGGAGALQTPGARGIILPDNIPFGAVRIGESAVASFEILSVGSAPLLVNVSASCGDYQIVSGGGEGMIATGDARTVIVAYAPTGSGASPCTISIGPGIPEVPVTGSGISVSFSADVRPIFYENCSFCHYDFGDDTGHDTRPYLLINNRIVPGDPDHSVIYNRIANTGRYGSLMPQGGPQLPAVQIETIRRWILEGALDN